VFGNYGLKKKSVPVIFEPSCIRDKDIEEKCNKFKQML